ncbi:MAG: hypothetical protein QM762_17790 [Chryseolinea sp.]
MDTGFQTTPKLNSPYNKTKIALIACYIGKLPWYFDYFALTCGFNPSIDFYIITDHPPGQRLPANVIIIHKSLDDIRNAAVNSLGFTVQIHHPYKLCDFKPTFGLLFFDLIKDYDYWGYCDIDVVFGNIRGFITEDILEEHDIISVRHDFLTGFFQLFRNNESMRRLFMESRDYCRVLQSPEHFCFDETNFQFDAFAAGTPVDEVRSEIESMMHVVKRMESAGKLKAFFDFMIVEGVPGNIKWCEGKLVYRNRFEILLYHMIHFKKSCIKSTYDKLPPNSFRITTKQIHNVLKNVKESSI